MKRVLYLLVTIALGSLLIGCNKISYHKTKSGLLYKIIPGGSKDTVRSGAFLKLQVIQKRNDDTTLQTSYGKMPVYAPAASNPQERPYGPEEILSLLKKGDSAIVIMFVDSLISKKLADEKQLPPYLKKGDKLTITLKVIDVLDNQALFEADREAEYKKDQPRQQKAQAEEMAKAQKEMKERQEKELADLEKSGEGAAQRKVVEDYLKAKHITAQKTGGGTYVEIKEPGTGPQAVAGKYLTVKYTGRRLAAPDSTFESNTYPNLQIGTGGVIPGWDEGLLLFKEGGKGTLYIPAYRGYGKNIRPGGPIKVNDALIFEVEVLTVSDKPL